MEARRADRIRAMASETHDRSFIPLGIAVLTVSDTRSLADDRSGDTLSQRLTEAGHRLADRAIVTDDVPDGALAVARGRQATKPGWAEAKRAALARHRDAGVLDGTETDLQLLRQQAAGIGQHQPRAMSLEQLAIQMLLQGLHVPAHRTLGDEQALRRLGERAEARRHLERTQRIQRRHARYCHNGFRHD